MRLAGKVALVTGAARGLGAAIARRFAEEGARVVLADIRLETVRDVVRLMKSNGLEATDVLLDVSDERSWADTMEAVRNTYGPLDILVNNAGVAMLGSIEETSMEEWRSIMAVNLDGVFLGTKLGIEEMRDRGGIIINMSSIRAFAADPDSVAYDASKGGVLSLTKSAAIHCAKAGNGIRINSLHPGYVMTDMIEEATENMDDADELKSLIQASHPIGRTGTEQEIANAALFLASNESSFMLGSSLIVDGGFTAV